MCVQTAISCSHMSHTARPHARARPVAVPMMCTSLEWWLHLRHGVCDVRVWIAALDQAHEFRGRDQFSHERAVPVDVATVEDDFERLTST